MLPSPWEERWADGNTPLSISSPLLTNSLMLADHAESFFHLKQLKEVVMNDCLAASDCLCSLEVFYATFHVWWSCLNVPCSINRVTCFLKPEADRFEVTETEVKQKSTFPLTPDSEEYSGQLKTLARKDTRYPKYWQISLITYLRVLFFFTNVCYTSSLYRACKSSWPKAGINCSIDLECRSSLWTSLAVD